jgi:methyltransferase (TIGR00027 family)
MAFYRALESARPRGKRLFSDPLAIHFLRPSLRIWAAASRIPYVATAVAWYADHLALGARTSAIARTRLIDDLVAEALRCGIRQAVILGAGFDCRIYRLPGMNSVAAFEVDHPATLAAKLSRLRRLVPNLPGNTRFVGIDFQRQGLAETLHQAGFDSRQLAIFLWEGVTNYLTAEAVDRVFRYVATCAGGSRLIFTYVHRGALDGSAEFPDAAAITRNVARVGEPWTLGLIPEELSSYLGARGLRLDRDSGARQYRAEYFGKAAEAMHGYNFYHVAAAHVAAGA